MTSATSLLPVLEIPEAEEDTIGVSTTSPGRVAESRRSPMSPRLLQLRSTLKETDFLVNAETGESFASSERRFISNMPSLVQHEAVGDMPADGTSRRRSINAAKEHLLPHDMYVIFLFFTPNRLRHLKDMPALPICRHEYR